LYQEPRFELNHLFVVIENEVSMVECVEIELAWSTFLLCLMHSVEV
jgi:hypothetical protein